MKKILLVLTTLLFIILTPTLIAVVAKVSAYVEVSNAGSIVYPRIGHGTGEDYLGYQRTGNSYITWWNNTISLMQKWPFTTVRLSFAFPDSPPIPSQGHCEHSILDYNKLDNVLTLLSSRGFKCILDCHNINDMLGWFGSDAWIADWTNLATRYAGDNRIFAYELFNEPFQEYWNTTKVQVSSDVPKAYADLTDRIRVIDPNRKVIWGLGPWYYGWTIMPQYIRENIIYSVHEWFDGNSVNAEIIRTQDHLNHMLQWRIDIGEVWLGEFGVVWSRNLTVQNALFKTWVNWCVQYDIPFNIWLYASDAPPGEIPPDPYDALLMDTDFKFS